MSKPLTGKPQLNREVNRRLILERIRKTGEISRAELAKVTRIRPPTVSAVIKELLGEGLVEETGSGATSGGRAPTMVALKRGQPRALGFEVSDKEILAGVSDLAGDLRQRVRVQFAASTPQDTVDQLYSIGEKLLTEAGLDWSGIHGVGVAIPGLLNTAKGVVRWSRPLGWQNVSLRTMCEVRWGTPTDVVNDSLAGSMASQFLGKANGVKNLVYFYLRFLDTSHGVVGLGSGIILNGEPYHGEFGAAGEITTPVEHPIKDARDRNGNPFNDMESFIEAVEAGEGSAVMAIDRVTRDISTLVLHAVNLLEPGQLIIGSDVEVLRDEVMTRLQRVVEEHQLLFGPGQTKITASTLGEYDVVRGAVVPTLQRVFRMPRWS